MGSAKLVLHFDVQGSVAKSTPAGILRSKVRLRVPFRSALTFRAPKSASEADQEQRPVARVVRGVGRSDGADRMNCGPRGY